MTRINTITLDGVLPEVFAGEPPRESDVWATHANLRRGDAYRVSAASGTGKTSLCSFLMGVRRDYLGSISFDSRDIRSLSRNDWGIVRRSHLAYLPQELDLFEELSAADNVMLKNRLTDFKTESEIRAMFEELGIDNRYNAPVGRMSVGQRQRVALIRALCQPFDFILLDEPVSHLDSENNRLCGLMVAHHAAALEAGIISTSVGNPLVLEGPSVNLEL